MKNEHIYFNNKASYKRYLYAKSIAEKVNELKDKGYLVYVGKRELNKFVFKDNIMGKPCISERLSKSVISTWVGNIIDNNNLIVIEPLREIKSLFKRIKYIKPEDFHFITDEINLEN